VAEQNLITTGSRPHGRFARRIASCSCDAVRPLHGRTSRCSDRLPGWLRARRGSASRSGCRSTARSKKMLDRDAAPLRRVQPRGRAADRVFPPAGQAS
jgi:hypothetical protein